jgi:hypothetical protein
MKWGGNCVAVQYYSSTQQRRSSMAKGMTQRKATKKKPAKTMMEKRADKIAKKRG